MLLCVDVGNTLTKVAVVEGDRVAMIGARRTRGELRGLPRLIADIDREGLDGVVVSSVVPRVTDGVLRALRRWTGHVPFRVAHSVRLPFRLHVAHPERLGADRICAAAGAVKRSQRGAIVIDIGSAVTVDRIQGGTYHGGPIFAGPRLILRALAQYAEQLPAVDEVSPPGDPTGRPADTAAAMALGAGLEVAGGIREAVRYHERASRRYLTRVVTGGGVTALDRYLPARWRRDPHAVVRGMARIWQLNAR